MKKCPKCNKDNTNQAHFCIDCGYSFNKEQNKLILNILSVLGIFFVLYFTIIIWNYFYEKKNSAPFSMLTNFATTTCTSNATYNKDTRIIHLNLYCNERIEKWQREALGRNKVNVELVLNYPHGEKKYKSENLNLEVGQDVHLEYYIYNSSLTDYVRLKKYYSNSAINMPSIISFDKKIRKQEKNKYLAKKEEERKKAVARAQAAAASAQARARLYNMFFNPYGYYGYY